MKDILKFAVTGACCALGFQYAPRFLPESLDFNGLPVRGYAGAAAGAYVAKMLTKSAVAK